MRGSSRRFEVAQMAVATKVRFRPPFLSSRYCNLRSHGVRDEALLVSLVVQPRDFIRGWLPLAAIEDRRVQFDVTDPKHSVLVLAHPADGGIFVTIDNKPGFRGQPKKREHVAARY